MVMQRMLLLNGPNLDMLGMREPEVYGSETLGDLESTVTAYARERGIALSCFQSNSESQLIGKIQRAANRFDGVVYNPGAHTHYSYALRDAIASVDVPVVEVHISNVDEREPFRRVSVIAPVCVAQVKGLGFEGYCRAVDILCDHEVFERLGEGYERRYPKGSAVIVAGVGEVAAPRVNAEPRAEGQTQQAAQEQLDQLRQPVQPAQPAQTVLSQASAAAQTVSRSEQLTQPQQQVELQFVSQPQQPQQPQQPVQDFTAQYAQEIAMQDPGLVSFERLGTVRAMCSNLGLDALLVRDTSNIRWITAFDGVFDEERAHALLVAPDRTELHTDSRYSNALRNAADRASDNIVINDERASHAQFAAKVLAREGAAFACKLGIEDSITYAEFVKMAETVGTSNLMATTDAVVGLRAVKSKGELIRMLAAQAVTDAAFMHILDFIRPGMTEREVQMELDDYMLRHGGEGLAFSTIVATGANGADPHAIPGATRFEAGQCVVMDFGAKAFGYCSDMTRTVFLGEPSRKMLAAWETLRRANETVETMLRPGVTGREAHETAEQVLAQGGFGGKMGHGLGHGVGLEVHELPVLNTRNELPLVEGNVVTVEPGIYLPGEFGMRLEDCGVVTENGYEVFTRLGHEMVVL